MTNRETETAVRVWSAGRGEIRWCARVAEGTTREELDRLIDESYHAADRYTSEPFPGQSMSRSPAAARTSMTRPS